MKKLKLILIVAILVFTISIVVIYFEGKKKNRQKETKKSLQEGFGYYGDEESLGCFSSDGKCTTEGVETTVQYCKPHPHTKRGCIDKHGNQTYATVINKRPCRTQCASSKFTVEEGLRIADPSVSYLGTSISHTLKSAGCDNIIDKKFGLDFTKYFLGNFDETQGKYPLKTCIPGGRDSNFKGYYQKVSSCLPVDGKGSNNCRVMCGRDKNIINLNGFANAKLNKNLISYFPTEINEEGDVRNVCYDINNIDQIELLNYPGKVPDDFIYPNKCYKHTNVLDFTSDIWPTSGVSNIFNINAQQVIADVSYMDLIGNQIDQFNNYVSDKIISSEYDLNRNQNSYVKLRIGNDISLLEKIYPETTTSLYSSATENRISQNIYYICCKLSSSDNLNAFETYLQGGPKISDFYLNGTANVFSSIFAPNSYDKKYFIINRSENEIFFPCPHGAFFQEIIGGGIVTKDTANTYINNSNIIGSSSDDYFYIINKNDTDNSIQHIFSKANTVETGVATFNTTSLFDDYNINIENLYLFNKTTLASSINNNNQLLITFSYSSPAISFPITLDFNKSFFSKQIYTKQFGTSVAAFDKLEIKKTVDQLVEELGDKNQAYCVFSTSPNNNTVGYNYPLYLKQTPKFIEKVTFNEFPGVDFYTLKGASVREITSNYYYRPFYYKNEGLSFFNEEILTASSTYTNNYINFNSKKNYFLSDLKLINYGFGYEEGKMYSLYNKNFDRSYDLKRTGLTYGQGLSPTMAIIPTQQENTPIKTIKIIRGNSPIVSGGVGAILEFTPNQEKVKKYFEMIKYQNFISDSDELLIFEPEKHLSLEADYSVFKSPYTLNEDNSPNFLCYDETGRLRPEGYVTEIPPNSSKVYTNIACPNKTVEYEVLGDKNAICGVKGIEDTNVNQKNKLEYCTQERDEKAINYFGSSLECIVSTDTSDYKTIKNQLGFGLKLRPIKKGTSFRGNIDNDILTYPSYFTKLVQENKLYGPGEEFFVEKLENNYYVSLSNNNLSFVDNVAQWRRIYPFQNNTEISPYQYFFNVHPPNIVDNKINIGLGKFPTVTYKLKINKGTDINIAFNTITSGITSQNYLNQGITYFWGGQRKEIVSNNQLKAGQPARPADLDLNNTLLTRGQGDDQFVNFHFGLNWKTADQCPTSSTTQANISAAWGDGTTVAHMCFRAMGGYYDAGGKYAVNVKGGGLTEAYKAGSPGKRITFKTTNGLVKGVAPKFSIETFIGRILLATQRINYEQLTATTGANGGDGNSSGPYPGYASLKFQPVLSTNPRALYPESPIVATFDIVKTEKFKFSSKFYDSNLDIPWESSNMKIGDYFNPDFIYFNTFIYSYILSNSGTNKYGYPGTTIVSELNPIFLTSSSAVTTFKLSDIKAPSGFTIEISSGYNNPKISDFILVIPADFFTTDSDGNYVLDNGPVVYPTMQIRRIQEINDSSNNIKTVKFEDKTYSNAKEFNSETNVVDVYLINLGKQTGKDNLITRTFQIKDISEIAFPVTTKISQSNIKDMKYIATKKFIEFEFEIDSISQAIMKSLYTKNNQRKTADTPKPTVLLGKTTARSSGTSPCAGNVIRTYQEEGVPDWSCFPAGCMPGDAPANSMCYSELDSVGYTDLGCPAGKYWRCPDKNTGVARQNQENINSYQRFGGNFLTPALSARYIKSSFQSPYVETTSGSTFPTLNNASREDILKTKVMAQCTEMAKYAGDIHYYFNEFREHSDMITPTQPLTFKIGDKFKYYQGILGMKEILTGNKNFHQFAEFKVVDINIVYSSTAYNYINQGVSGTPGTPGNSIYGYTIPTNSETLDVDLNYDYKCILVKGSLDKFNTVELASGGGTFPKNNNIIYNNTMDLSQNTNRRSVPYTVSIVNKDNGDELLYQRATFLGYNKDNGYVFVNEKFLQDAQSLVNLDFTTTEAYNDSPLILTKNPGDAHLDYYNFNSGKLPDPFTIEPSFGLKADANFNGPTGYKNSTDFPGGFEYNNLLKFVGMGQEPSFTSMENLIGENSVNSIKNFFLDSSNYQDSFTQNNNFVDYNLSNYKRIGSDGHFMGNYFELETLGGVGLTLRLATVLSGGAIRSGMLDMMVLSGTEVSSDIGQKAYIDVTVSGKPYGVGYFPSGPVVEDSMINYNAFGKIESFKFISPQNLPVNTVLKSDKGFQIKFLAEPPPVYTFENIESPSNDVLNYKDNFNYATSEIVSVKNRNLRQYFRNTGALVIPYMKQISVTNPYIPFSILSGAVWFYPVYRYQIPGTTPLNLEGNKTVYVKDKYYTSDTNTSPYIDNSVRNKDLYEILNSFKSVAITVYPEDNFVDYDSGSYYGKGDVVKNFEDNENRLYKSLISKNIGKDPLTDTDAWAVDDLTGKLSSFNSSNFYSVFKEDDNFTTYINDIKNLNNQNLPALIKNSLDNTGQKEFCPQQCTLYNPKEDYGNTFIQSSYFNNIRYLFQSPVMLTKKGTSLLVSLGNAPVSKASNYNTGFLQNGGAKNNFLSQYLYFINIIGDEEKYDRPLCTGNFSITTPTGISDTDANKFEFANSLLFNFLPCSLDDQDFIKYRIDNSEGDDKTFLVSSLPEYPSSSTPNIFPDFGVSCHVLISSKNGTCFTPSYGSFEYTYVDYDNDKANEITLIGPSIPTSRGTSTLTVSSINRVPFFHVDQHDTILSYGDNWYMEGGDPNDTPFGFVIPYPSVGINTKNQRSFMQLNRSTNYTNASNIRSFPEEPIKSFSVTDQPNNFIISTNNIPNPGTTSGAYISSGGNSSYHIQFNGSNILQRGQAIFYGDTPIQGAENIYLPTYDITKNIKAQAVTAFGENFIGDLNYSLDKKNSVYSLDGKEKSVMVFNEFRNDLLLTDIDKRKSEVFVGDKTINVENLYKTFLINFDNDTFSIKPNLYQSPILNPTNKFLYSGTSSVNALQPISCINTESTTVLISEGMSGLQGTSVNLNFDDFLKYNRDYSVSNNEPTSIPGKTNAQVQLTEVRQNVTDTYIDKTNKCSIYFEPILGTKATAYSAATWKIKVITAGSYFTGSLQQSSTRFSGTFTNNTQIKLFEETTFFLGCNLSYTFDQSDKSNTKPMVFSETEFEEKITDPSTIIISGTGNKKFNIQYLLEGEKVGFNDYSDKFSSSKKRSIEIMYQGDFNLTSAEYRTLSGTSIYYGINESPFSKMGGKIGFRYH